MQIFGGIGWHVRGDVCSISIVAVLVQVVLAPILVLQMMSDILKPSNPDRVIPKSW